MVKAKFWLFQIVMLAIVSLVFGSPVVADVDTNSDANYVSWSNAGDDDSENGEDSDDDDGGDDDDDGGSTTPPPDPEVCPPGTFGTPPNCFE